MRQQWADYRVFWREFRQTYHSTGAVLPSGRALAAALCRFVREAEGNVSFATSASPNATPQGEAGGAVGTSANTGQTKARRILEVGPGTGAVTGHIIDAMRPTDQLILVERNDQFVTRLRAQLANEERFALAADRITLLHQSVEDVAENEAFDLIISGLPLNNFSVELVEQILDKLRRLLTPGGTLSFFEYVAIRRVKSVVSSRAERERLRGVARVLANSLDGKEIHRDLVFANVPPAWVHHVRFE